MPKSSPSFSDPIQKTSVVDTLAGKLRERILKNELRAGEPLRQEALAEAYGVSRMPIREAFRQLEAEGLVEFHPHRGAVVSAMSIEEAEELFDLRLAIETDLIQRAIENATEQDKNTARAALKAVQDAYSSGDEEHWGALNWAFHKSLYTASARPRSLALLDGLNANIDRYVRLQLSLERSAPDRANIEHDQMLQAFTSGNGEEARSILQQHIQDARSSLLAALRERQVLADA
ncbi:GntR family transcriptional regulator [Maricaulis sp.]|uniref:GntR family transcriptional regulator n=1 Tax=unclassified Maricaulis TaxID=2632371 RepID=UPI001B26FF25|nr:GntR family transcriptional regulator [Maricaulis sp.]MBO6795531.1 GntR family transcriptional regulator [Maricaulis sp.]